LQALLVLWHHEFVEGRSPGMPNSAIATGCVDHVLPLDHIGVALVVPVMAPGGDELLAVPTPPRADLTA
jgi:two-component system chemotaxis response regulator CheB